MATLVDNVTRSARRAASRLWSFGRKPTPKTRPFAEMGVSGTAVWGGYVQVKERSPDWIGRQKYITSTELAVNTSIVAAGVHYFLNLVAYPKWTVRPSDDDDEEAVELAEFVDEVLNKMMTPWYKVVRRAAMYRFHGFGVQEWTAKIRDDGLIGFKDIEARPQHTIEQWDVDVDGSVMGVWQRSPQTGALLGLPRRKLMYLVEDTLTDSPEGLGLFRHMADPYQRLKMLQELEIRAYERDMRGIPIARMPLAKINEAVEQGVMTQDDAAALISDMESLTQLQVKQSNTGLILDSVPYFSQSADGPQVSGVPQWGFELLAGGGVGHAEIAGAIDRLQREMARMIGVEHLMMGDVGGNRSLAEDKSRNLYLIANSVLKYAASQAEHDIINPLWFLNGFDWEKKPTLETEDVTFKNADAITAALNKMASSGAVLAPNDPVINDVRDLLGVSRVPDDLMAAGAQPQLPPELAGLIPPQLQAPGRVGIQPPPKGPPSGGPPPAPQSGGPGGLPPPPTGGKPGSGGAKEEEEPDPRFRAKKRRGAETRPFDEAGDLEKGYPEYQDSQARNELGQWTDGAGDTTYEAKGRDVVVRGIRTAVNKRIPSSHRDFLKDGGAKFYGVGSIPAKAITSGNVDEGDSVFGLMSSSSGFPEIFVAANATGMINGKLFTFPLRNVENVALHEAGHAIDFLSGWKLNDAFYMPMLQEALLRMDKGDAANGWYFLSTPHEAFAALYQLTYGREIKGDVDVVGFFGGMSKKEALKVFKGSVAALRKLNLHAFNRAPGLFIRSIQQDIMGKLKP